MSLSTFVKTILFKFPCSVKHLESALSASKDACSISSALMFIRTSLRILFQNDSTHGSTWAARNVSQHVSYCHNEKLVKDNVKIWNVKKKTTKALNASTLATVRSESNFSCSSGRQYSAKCGLLARHWRNPSHNCSLVTPCGSFGGLRTRKNIKQYIITSWATKLTGVKSIGK